MGNSFSEGDRSRASDHWVKEDGEGVMRKVAIAKLFPDDNDDKLCLLEVPAMCHGWDRQFQENADFCRIEAESYKCKLIRKRVAQCEAINKEVEKMTAEAEKMTNPVGQAEKADKKHKEHAIGYY